MDCEELARAAAVLAEEQSKVLPKIISRSMCEGPGGEGEMIS